MPQNKYRQVDDYQYGGEAGMVIMIEPVDQCLTALKEKKQIRRNNIYVPRWRFINSKNG
jgi:tRNA (guanine37-N1)-methyltransferase